MTKPSLTISHYRLNDDNIGSKITEDLIKGIMSECEFVNIVDHQVWYSYLYGGGCYEGAFQWYLSEDFTYRMINRHVDCTEDNWQFDLKDPLSWNKIRAVIRKRFNEIQPERKRGCV